MQENGGWLFTENRLLTLLMITASFRYIDPVELTSFWPNRLKADGSAADPRKARRSHRGSGIRSFTAPAGFLFPGLKTTSNQPNKETTQQEALDDKEPITNTKTSRSYKTPSPHPPHPLPSPNLPNLTLKQEEEDASPHHHTLYRPSEGSLQEQNSMGQSSPCSNQ